VLTGWSSCPIPVQPRTKKNVSSTVNLGMEQILSRAPVCSWSKMSPVG
jgi:hypothetical protein